MRTRLLALACFAGLLSAAGCQKLNVEKTINVPMGITQEAFSVDPPRSQQKVTVTIEPQSASVSAYLVKTEEKEAVDRALFNDKEPPASGVLGSRISTGDSPETYSFDATVPAKQGYTILLKGNKKKSTDVKIKVVGS
jgi:hypothetical protein